MQEELTSADQSVSLNERFEQPLLVVGFAHNRHVPILSAPTHMK